MILLIGKIHKMKKIYYLGTQRYAVKLQRKTKK